MGNHHFMIVKDPRDSLLMWLEPTNDDAGCRKVMMEARNSCIQEKRRVERRGKVSAEEWDDILQDCHYLK